MHLNQEKLLKYHLKGITFRKWANGLKIYDSEKKLDPRGQSAPTLGQYTCILQKCSNTFFSETALPIKAKIYMKHLQEKGINVFINNLGHMTKMAPIFSKTAWRIKAKLIVEHP